MSSFNNRESSLIFRMTAVSVVAAVVVIAGCATLSPRAAFISSSDSCSKLREPFVEVREKQRNQIVKWTAIGATAGVAAAFASGDTDKKKIILGAIGGGLVGAVTGYYKNLNNRASQTVELRNTIFTDAEADANGGDELVAGVSRLNACRMKSLDEIAVEVQSGAIGKGEARSRLALVKQRTQDDNKLIDSVSRGLAKRSSIYVSALQLSGAEDADKYIAEAEAYNPIVQKPKYAISRLGASQSAEVTFSESPLDESERRQILPPKVQVLRDRPAPAPITIKKRPKAGENSIAATAKGVSELDAMVVAHLESVDEAIGNIEAVLL